MIRTLGRRAKCAVLRCVAVLSCVAQVGDRLDIQVLRESSTVSVQVTLEANSA